jgi:mRNA deadenylase 3'-5' endonuclease subunit Ccr4
MEKQNKELFVLTWNLLAPIFVRPNADQQDFAYFGHCSDADLDWDRRKAGIQARLREINADVVLMQG